jgi:hypothetical protein
MRPVKPILSGKLNPRYGGFTLTLCHRSRLPARRADVEERTLLGQLLTKGTRADLVLPEIKG